MTLTYTDKNLKVILHSWGRFRVTISEPVQPGDALSWLEDSDYTVQLASQDGEERADCFATEEGDTGDTIMAALAVELKSADVPTTGGVVGRVYFAADGDDLGSPLYLGDEGKPSSDVGDTYAQIIGQVLARDRIMLNVTGSATGPTFSTTITPDVSDGAALGTGSLMWSDLFLANGGVINFNNGAMKLTHVHGTYMEELHISDNERLCFRDEGMYIHSDAAGKLLIVASGTESSSITIHAGTNGGIYIGGYLQLFASATATGVSADGQLWYNPTADEFKGRADGGICTFVLEEKSGTFTANQTMGTNTRLNFRDEGIYIYSNAAGKLSIYASDLGPSAICLIPGTKGGVYIGGYLQLFESTTGAADTEADGQIWYNPSDDKFYGRADGAIVSFNVT